MVFKIAGVRKKVRKTILKELRDGTLFVVDENGEVERYVKESKQDPKRKRAQKSKNSATKPKSLAEEVAAMPQCVVKLNRIDTAGFAAVPMQMMPMNEIGRIRLNQSIHLDNTRWLSAQSSILRILGNGVIEVRMANQPDNMTVVSKGRAHSSVMCTLSGESIEPKKTFIFDRKVWEPIISLIGQFFGQYSNERKSIEPKKTIIFDAKIWKPILSAIACIFGRHSNDFDLPLDHLAMVHAAKVLTHEVSPIEPEPEPISMQDFDYKGSDSDDAYSDESDDGYNGDSSDGDSIYDTDCDCESSLEEPMSVKAFHAKYAKLMGIAFDANKFD